MRRGVAVKMRWLVMGLCLVVGMTAFAIEETVNPRVKLDDRYIPPPTRNYVKRQIAQVWDVCVALFPAKANPPRLVVRTVGSDRLSNFYRDQRRRRYIVEIPLDLGQQGLSRANLAMVIDAAARVLNERGNAATARGEPLTPDWLIAAIQHRMSDELSLNPIERFPITIPIYPGISAMAMLGINHPSPESIVDSPFPVDETAVYELYTEVGDLLLSYHQAAGATKCKALLGQLMQKVESKTRNDVTLYKEIFGEHTPKTPTIETVPFSDFASRRIFTGTIHSSAQMIWDDYWVGIRETVEYLPKSNPASDSIVEIEFCALPQLGEKLTEVDSWHVVRSKIMNEFEQLSERAAVGLRPEIKAVQRLIGDLTPANAKDFRKHLGEAESALRHAVTREKRLQSYLNTIERRFIPTESTLHRERRILMEAYREKQVMYSPGNLWLDDIEKTFYEFQRTERDQNVLEHKN